MKGTFYDYKNESSDAHFKLTRAELAHLIEQMKNIPIRIEHETLDIGKVIEASFDESTQCAIVEWELDNTPAGWSAERLVELNAASELSLKHVKYADGRLLPIEMSLVQRGARPNSRISQVYKKENEKPVYQTVMASANADTVITDAAPIEVAAPVVSDEQPVAKKMKYDNPVELLNALSTKVSDVDTLNSIADFLADQMENSLKTKAEMDTLRAAKEALEEANTKALAGSKTVVQDVVSVLSQLYGQFAPDAHVSADSQMKFAELLSSNHEALQFAQPLLVAASAIQRSVGVAAANTANTALTSATARLSALQSQLNSARGMTTGAAPSSVAPAWQPVAAVEVAATAHQAAAPPAFRIPDILKLPSYNDSNSTRFMPDMLRK